MRNQPWNTMRVLLHDTIADRYFRSAEHWTSDPESAWNFGGTVAAVDLAWKRKLHNVEVVLEFDHSNLTMHLPLDITGGY